MRNLVLPRMSLLFCLLLCDRALFASTQTGPALPRSLALVAPRTLLALIDVSVGVI